MLEVTDAGFHYRRGDWVFRHCGLTGHAGNLIAIMGPNGRGKTTLLKAIIGLHTLDEGRIAIDAATSYVPQSHQTVFDYRVLDMVVMGRARHIGFFGAPNNDDYALARDALTTVGAERFAERSFSELSGGEQQLVLIARALASQCKVLILDEPASALDFANQDRVLTTLAALAESGLLIVFTTHYPSHAAHVASHVMMMYGPTDFAFGPRTEVMTDDALSRLYGMDVRHVEVPGVTAPPTVVPVFS